MDIEKKLKDIWKRCTKERVNIFSFFESEHVVSALKIEKKFTWMIGRASVFRTLKLFLDYGIIRKVQTIEKGDFYEINDKHAHHEHFHCKGCWEYISFESEKLCKRIFDEAMKIGFKIQEHNIWVFWLCQKCW